MYFVYLYPELCLVMMILIVKSSSICRHMDALCEGDVMELHLNQTASDMSDIVLTFNGTQIAESTNVENMKWDPDLSETYKGRLTLSNSSYLRINLQHLTTNDTGTYKADVTTKSGKLKTIPRNICVSAPPVVEKKFKITTKKDGKINIFTCGKFSDFGKPPVTFKWNVSESSNHSIRLPNKPSLHCSVVGPAVETCGINLTADYDEPSSSYESSYDGTDPGTDPTNPVPIVVGVLALIAIAVITVIIVFYKRRSRTPTEQEPPGSDSLFPMNG